MKRFLLLIITFLFTTCGFAQIDTSDVQQNFESVLEDATVGNENSQIFDSIEFLSSNPITINSATINDLMRIPFLDRSSAAAIIRHRNRLGGLYSASQLKNVEDVSDDLIAKILPYLKFGSEKSPTLSQVSSDKLETIKITYRSRGIYDIQPETGFTDGDYPGSRWKIYNRFTASKENGIRLGILTEKDAGEKKINDFTSGNLTINNLGFIKSLIFGDYLVEFGQGLAVWSRYSLSKGTETVSVLPRNSKNLTPYLSSDENQFMRGAAVLFQFGNLSISTFYSNKSLDASVDSSSSKITSLIIDGLHRTESELKKKGSVSEQIFGTTAEYSFGDFGNVGFLYFYSKYSNNFSNNSFLDPTGNSFNYLSTDFSFNTSKLFFTGEVATDKKSIAALSSLEIAVDNNFSILFSYRNYPARYWNVHSNGFGEHTFAQNETGFYTGIKWKTNFGIIRFYYDQFKFFITGNNYLFPTKGNDLLLYYTFNPTDDTELRIRYKNGTKESPVEFNNENGLVKQVTNNIRTEFLFQATKKLQLRSRFEFVDVSTSNSSTDRGYLFFEDIRFSPFSNLMLSSRLVFFQSDSYNSRVYEFENDLTGVMSNPALYGEGTRWYLLVRYTTSFGLTLTLKYAELYKPNERFIGSGDAQINGNVDNRISFQMDFRF